MTNVIAWNKINNINDTVERLYDQGVSVKRIAETLGVSRTPIHRVIVERGLKVRGGSEANLIRFRNASIDERKNITRKANDAVRGHGRSKEWSRSVARSRSRRIGKGEKEIIEWLSDAGIPVDHQAPIDVYNVDFLVGSNIAVELRIGRGHGFYREHFREKVKYLTNSHTVLLIFANDTDALFANRQHLIADVEIVHRDPSPPGEAWMIFCRSHRFARGRDDAGKFTAEPCPINFSYSGKIPYYR